MKVANFTFGWVDLVIVLLLCVGVMRGRKRGMSEELLVGIQWTLIVVLAGLAYEPGGRLLASQFSVFSLLACYVAVYALVAVTIKVVFSLIRQQVGDKLMSSAIFGDGEYYLGMVAGAFRYGCIVLVFMAFLSARHYSVQELRAAASFQQENFGDISFPTLSSLQDAVFKDSWTGRLTKQYLPVVLIKPTAPEDKGLGGSERLGSRRERSVNEMLDRR